MGLILELRGVPDPSFVLKGSRYKHFFNREGAPLDLKKANGNSCIHGSSTLSEILKGANESFIQLISSCLRWDPTQRITPSEALKHIWFSSYFRKGSPKALPTIASTTRDSNLSNIQIINNDSNQSENRKIQIKKNIVKLKYITNRKEGSRDVEKDNSNDYINLNIPCKESHTNIFGQITNRRGISTKRAKISDSVDYGRTKEELFS